jgi:hypothetical protein
MNEATVCAVIPRLGKGESAEVPLTAFFNESILDLTGNINGSARVLAAYRSLGALKEADIPVGIPIYHRNAMSWDDDRRAASFVSARDPAAAAFARYIESVVAGRLRPGVSANIQYALGLFEALNVYGLQYFIDPASSYAQLSGDALSLDALNYPYQTLLYRGGDCDDISILFSSLLEVLKIDSAFITTPGHIYIAFDPGEEMEGLIEREGRLWMPLEITVPRQGFLRAWRAGLRQWEEAGAEARLYPMKESWAIYPPVSVPAAGRRGITLPDEAAAARAFETGLVGWPRGK